MLSRLQTSRLSRSVVISMLSLVLSELQAEKRREPRVDFVEHGLRHSTDNLQFPCCSIGAAQVIHQDDAFDWQAVRQTHLRRFCAYRSGPAFCNLLVRIAAISA